MQPKSPKLLCPGVGPRPLPRQLAFAIAIRTNDQEKKTHVRLNRWKEVPCDSHVLHGLSAYVNACDVALSTASEAPAPLPLIRHHVAVADVFTSLD